MQKVLGDFRPDAGVVDVSGEDGTAATELLEFLAAAPPRLPILFLIPPDVGREWCALHETVRGVGYALRTPRRP